MEFKRKGDKTRYGFVDKRCIGRPCWAPGFYQHRSPLSCGGSRNTGSPDSACCMNRAYHGCPSGPEGEHTETCINCNENGLVERERSRDGDLPEYEYCWICGGTRQLNVAGLPVYDPALAAKRKADGWKRA